MVKYMNYTIDTDEGTPLSVLHVFNRDSSPVSLLLINLFMNMTLYMESYNEVFKLNKIDKLK